MAPPRKQAANREDEHRPDFGLAKALVGQGGDAAESPTVTAAATRHGVILGTAAYMSPEQARGKAVDKRSDIWAFRAVLYETLSGKRPFEGRHVSEVLGSVLRLDPDWDALPGHTPSYLRVLLKRCLEKEPKDRYHDIADVRLDLRGMMVDTRGELTDLTPAVLPAPRRFLPWVAAVLVGLVGAAAGWSLRPVAVSPTARLIVPIPGADRLSPGEPAVSPDGELLAYAWGPPGARTLSLHRLDDPEGEAILEVDDGRQPFFSPDSTGDKGLRPTLFATDSDTRGAVIALTRALSTRSCRGSVRSWSLTELANRLKKALSARYGVGLGDYA